MSDFDADSLRKKVQQVNERLESQGFQSANEERHFEYIIRTVTKVAKENAEQGKTYAGVHLPLIRGDSQEYQKKVIEKTTLHFQSLGFEVEVHPAILSLEIETINVTIAKWQKVTANGNRISHLTN